MLRIASSVVVAAVSVVLCAAEATAANPPNPPPGTVAAQPMGVAAGSSSQPGSNASVSTGTAGAPTDAQKPKAPRHGVKARPPRNKHSHPAPPRARPAA